MLNLQTKHNCKDELNQVSLKATPARLGVLALMEKSSEPLDVMSVLRYLSQHKIKADQATVFRIVNILTEKGLLKPVQLNEGKFRYELAAKSDHHHLVCTKCGNIQDISDCNISGLERDIEKKKQFKVTSHALEFSESVIIVKNNYE